MSVAFNTKKWWRLALLLCYVIVACAVVFFLHPDYIVSILIVLVPPSIANFLWLRKAQWKILIFSLAATLLFAPPIELVLRLVDAWDVQSVFFRPFGLIPLENMLFAFLNFFWGLSFYEYFADKETRKVSGKFKYLLGLYLIFATIIYSLYFYGPSFLKTSYFGMSVLILVIPATLIFWQNPHLLKKTILPTIFFALVFFIYEMVSLAIGSWWWPGEYMFSFQVFGKPFPLDDVIIWYLLSTPALIGGYEYFIDDDR
jgi:hypothetical protein